MIGGSPMSRGRGVGAAWILLAALVLASGCTTPPLKSTLNQPPEPEPPAVVLEPRDAGDWAEEFESDLKDALESGPLLAGKIERLADSQLRLDLRPDAAFEPQSAQLKATALAPCAGIASAFREHPGSVLHVVAFSAADSDLEPELRLAARRATSVQNHLLLTGVPATRVRAEGRELPAGAADRLLLVFRPVIRGQELQAWVPPADSQ